MGTHCDVVLDDRLKVVKASPAEDLDENILIRTNAIFSGNKQFHCIIFGQSEIHWVSRAVALGKGQKECAIIPGGVFGNVAIQITIFYKKPAFFFVWIWK